MLTDLVYSIVGILIIGLVIDILKMISRERKWRQNWTSAFLCLLGVPQSSLKKHPNPFLSVEKIRDEFARPDGIIWIKKPAVFVS